MNEQKIRKVILDEMPSHWRAVIDPIAIRTDENGDQWYDTDGEAFKSFRKKFPAPPPAEVFDLRVEGPKLWRRFHIGTLVRDPIDAPKLANEIRSALGCMDCSKHWADICAEFPPPCTTPIENFAWGVSQHNRVNRRLKKDEVRWQDILPYWQEQAGLDDMQPLPSGSDRIALERSGRKKKAGPIFYSANGEEAGLNNVYAGRSAFLVLSGPSLRNVDLSLLRRRGALTMGVNNSWTVFKPNLWTSVDSPRRFSDVGWKDPSIIKFVPGSNIKKPIRETLPDGSRVFQGATVRDMPGVFYYVRNNLFDSKRFLTSPLVHWGNETAKKGKPKIVDDLGIVGKRSVMLSALHVLFGLGIRNVFLVGADFQMTPEDGYAFKEVRDEKTAAYNNELYKTLDIRFKALLPHFADHGFNVFNTTPNSGLTAFPKMELAEAVRRATSGFDVPLLTEGWYVEEEKKTNGVH
jgi:hypothetical protein